MNEIRLEQTCKMCPEQYWAWKGSHKVGYIRLRFGHLTCDYLPSGSMGPDEIRLVDYIFEGDNFKGCFDSEDERAEWLEICKVKLLEEYKHQKLVQKRDQLLKKMGNLIEKLRETF